MRNTLLAVTMGSGLAILLTGCGTPLNFGSVSNGTPTAPIPRGAILYLDSSYVNGSFSAPPSGCSTTWIDLSGNSNNGALTSFTCTGSSGWGGTGSSSSPYDLNFDNSGYVTTALDVQPSALPETTWEIWVYPTRLNYSTRQQLMSDDGGGFGRSLLIEASTSSFAAFTGSSGIGVWTPVTADLNTWQHLALVYSSSDILMYKNGTQYDRGTAYGGAGTTTKMLNIGANPSFGEKFEGAVALFAVYNRALSASEVSDHCKAYQSRFAGVTCN